LANGLTRCVSYGLFAGKPDSHSGFVAGRNAADDTNPCSSQLVGEQLDSVYQVHRHANKLALIKKI
ncbi:MAG: hypothetical protein ACOH2R_28725, partial [Pseudomonas sp.]